MPSLCHPTRPAAMRPAASPVRRRPGRGAVAAGLAALLMIGGCSPFLSGSGPRLGGILDASQPQPGDSAPTIAPNLVFTVVSLDPRVVNAVRGGDFVEAFAAETTRPQPTDVRIGVGDILAITIFESQAGGLFVPPDAGARPGNLVQVPPQQVNQRGFISVPFGGFVRAAGRMPGELQRAIAQSIAQRALEPQVIVTVQERRSSFVSVLGEVTNALRYPLDPGGDRLLGAIARAGGPKFPAYETRVSLQRGSRVQQAWLSDIARDPRQNIQLRGGDVVLVARQQRYFVALGAVGQTASVTQLNRRFAFEDQQITLIDAVGRAGGLQDDRSNPAAVFLFRYERPERLRQMGITPVSLEPDGSAPVVYRADLTNPSTFFLAQRFPMRHDDLIFVSVAPATDLSKFLNLLTPLTQSGAYIRTFQ